VATHQVAWYLLLLAVAERGQAVARPFVLVVRLAQSVVQCHTPLRDHQPHLHEWEAVRTRKLPAYQGQGVGQCELMSSKIILFELPVHMATGVRRSVVQASVLGSPP